MTTTNFKYWLDCLEEQDIETIANLYHSIVDVTEMGDFKTTKKGSRLFVQTPSNENTLMLASDLAKKTFLQKINREFGGEFGWVLGAAEFRRAMEKND